MTYHSDYIFLSIIREVESILTQGENQLGLFITTNDHVNVLNKKRKYQKFSGVIVGPTVTYTTKEKFGKPV